MVVVPIVSSEAALLVRLKLMLKQSSCVLRKTLSPYLEVYNEDMMCVQGSWGKKMLVTHFYKFYYHQLLQFL